MFKLKSRGGRCDCNGVLVLGTQNFSVMRKFTCNRQVSQKFKNAEVIIETRAPVTTGVGKAPKPRLRRIL